MKRLLLILILTLSFQSWTKADDIRDFEIEGMSIGDSLLDFFSKKDINSSKKYLYNSNKIATFYAPKNFSDQYEWVALNFFDKDNSYTLESIEGQIDYPNNIEDCYAIKNKIADELSKIFLNVEKDTYNGKHNADVSGKSTVESIHFYFKDSSEVRVACMDFSKNVSFTDYLMVAINSKKFMKFLREDAW